MNTEYNQCLNLVYKIWHHQFESLGISLYLLKRVLIPAHLGLLTRFTFAEGLTIWYVTKLGQLGPNRFWFTYLPDIDSNIIDKLCGRSPLKYGKFFECANNPGLSQVGLLKRRSNRLSRRYLTSVRTFLCYFKKLKLEGSYCKTDELNYQLKLEAKNESTCQSLSSLVSQPSWYAEHPNQKLYLLIKVRNILRSLLNPHSSLIDFQPKFGPGTTADFNRSISEKLESVSQVYLAVRLFFPNSFMPLWFRVSPKLQVHLIIHLTVLHFLRLFVVEIPSRGVIVPKTAVKGRFIASEPTVLGYLSMAVADYFDSSVSGRGLVGMSFVSQGRNQGFAKLASESQYFCTVDLSSASDLISKRLFLELFPPFLHPLISLLMTERIEFDSYFIRKFRLASMGNGITFRVLALICYCCSVASVMDVIGCQLFEADSMVSIYGDDICLPSDCFSRLKEYLTLFGLVVNDGKSFVKTRFAESCGHHYYDGMLVTPSYLRLLPTSPVNCASCVDHSRVLRTRGFHESAEIWERYLRAYFVQQYKIVIPKARGDAGFISFYDDRPYLPLQKISYSDVGDGFMDTSDVGCDPYTYGRYSGSFANETIHFPPNYRAACVSQVEAEYRSGRLDCSTTERLDSLLGEYSNSVAPRDAFRYEFVGSYPKHVWRTVLVPRSAPAGEKSFDSLLYNGLRGSRSDEFDYVKYRFGIRKTKRRILV